MTILSYELPKGAPRRFIWFAQCDVCHQFDHRPQVLASVARSLIVVSGWRSGISHPMDTCPVCLEKETR